MYFSSHLSDKQYFLSQKIDKNVVYLATTEDRSGLTRQELQCVVTRNETLSGYRNCIINCFSIEGECMSRHFVPAWFESVKTEQDGVL